MSQSGIGSKVPGRQEAGFRCQQLAIQQEQSELQKQQMKQQELRRMKENIMQQQMLQQMQTRQNTLTRCEPDGFGGIECGHF